MPPRYAKKIDATHTEIKTYLESHGVEVVDCSTNGNVPDLLLYWRGNVGWVECKVVAKNDVRYTHAQLKWIANTKFFVRIVNNKEDAMTFIQQPKFWTISQSQKGKLAVSLGSYDKDKLFTVNQVNEMMGEKL